MVFRRSSISNTESYENCGVMLYYLQLPYTYIQFHGESFQFRLQYAFADELYVPIASPQLDLSTFIWQTASRQLELIL